MIAIRRAARGRLLALLLPLVGLLTGVDRPANLLDVVDLRHWSYPDYTRVVLELSGEAAMKGAPQMLPPADGRPERLYLDLAGVWVGTRYAEGVPVGDGLLRGVRIGQNTERDVRVVLDLQNYGRHPGLFLEQIKPPPVHPLKLLNREDTYLHCCVFLI